MLVTGVGDKKSYVDDKYRKYVIWVTVLVGLDPLTNETSVDETQVSINQSNKFCVNII